MERDIDGFWAWFKGEAKQLAAIVDGSASGKVTDVLDAALSDHGLELTYEVSLDAHGPELTFTPEGDPDRAALVDRVAMRAGAVRGWTIHARRQPKALPSALAFVQAMHGIDLSAARFDVRADGDAYFICFKHDALYARSEDERFEIAATFLDHALGEAFTMRAVRGLEFAAAGDGVEMGLMVNQLRTAAA